MKRYANYKRYEFIPIQNWCNYCPLHVTFVNEWVISNQCTHALLSFVIYGKDRNPEASKISYKNAEMRFVMMMWDDHQLLQMLRGMTRDELEDLIFITTSCTFRNAKCIIFSIVFQLYDMWKENFEKYIHIYASECFIHMKLVWHSKIKHLNQQETYFNLCLIWLLNYLFIYFLF